MKKQKVKLEAPDAVADKLKKRMPKGAAIFAWVKRILALIPTALLAFILISQLFGASMIEDDLIYRDIQRETPKNVHITKMMSEDLHGYGNKSIICLAENGTHEGTEEANNLLLIFDKVDNKLFRQAHDMLGLKSSYRRKYRFSVYEPNWESQPGYRMTVEAIIDLNGDGNKEIILSMVELPYVSGYNSNVVILTYDVRSSEYKVAGTYPRLVEFYEDNNKEYLEPWPVNYYDQANAFPMTSVHNLDDYFFCTGSEFWDRAHEAETYCLVAVNCIWGEYESHFSPHQYRVTVLDPFFDDAEGTFAWTAWFSAITPDKYDGMTQAQVLDFIRNNME